MASFGTSGEPLIATTKVPEGTRDGRHLGLVVETSARQKPAGDPKVAKRTKHRARLIYIAIAIAALFLLLMLLLLVVSTGRHSILRAFRYPDASAAVVIAPVEGNVTGSALSTHTPRSAAAHSSFRARQLRALDLLVGAQPLPPFLRQPPPLSVRRGHVALLDAGAHSPLVSDAFTVTGASAVTINECRVAVGERADEPMGQRGGTLFPKVS